MQKCKKIPSFEGTAKIGDPLNVIEGFMERIRDYLSAKFPAVMVALLCAVLLVRPAAAEDGKIFTPRRSLGLVFLGGSAVMLKVGFDYKDKADDFYERYKRAVDPGEIERLYSRTNNRDIKSQISWALSAAFAISGLRLILSEGSKTSYGGRVALPAEGLRLESRIDSERIGFSLNRHFF